MAMLRKRKEGLSKSDAKFWKDYYTRRGYKVRVRIGKIFSDKYKYSVYTN